MSAPQAWWDHEPVMKNDLPVQAEVEEKPIEQKPKPQKRMSTLQKRTSQFLGLSLEETDAEKQQQKMNPPMEGAVLLLYSGWLKKQGHVVKNWKTRYVRIVLDGSSVPKTAYMSYYKTADNGIDIHRPGAQGVVQLRNAVLDSSSLDTNFKVTTESGVVYPFRADTESEKNVWVEHISTCISSCAEGAPSFSSSSPYNTSVEEDNSASQPPSWVSNYS